MLYEVITGRKLGTGDNFTRLHVFDVASSLKAGTNVLATLTAQSVMQLSSSLLLGVVGAIIMFVGTRHILDGTLTLGGYFTYTMFLGFLIARNNFV